MRSALSATCRCGGRSLDCTPPRVVPLGMTTLFHAALLTMRHKWRGYAWYSGRAGGLGMTGFMGALLAVIDLYVVEIDRADEF